MEREWIEILPELRNAIGAHAYHTGVEQILDDGTAVIKIPYSEMRCKAKRVEKRWMIGRPGPRWEIFEIVEGSR